MHAIGHFVRWLRLDKANDGEVVMVNPRSLVLLIVGLGFGTACRTEDPVQSVTQPPPAEPKNKGTERITESPSLSEIDPSRQHAAVPSDVQPGPASTVTVVPNPASNQDVELSAPAAETASGDGPERPVAAVSEEILSRTETVEKAEVKHILVGWRELAASYRGQIDPRAAARTKPEADAVIAAVLTRLKSGDGFDALMAEYSEDAGSATTAKSYLVTEDAALVPPFKNLGLRLHVNEVGIVETAYGWHIIKRIE